MNDADFTYAIRDDNKEYGFTSLPEAADKARQAAVQKFAGGFQWVAGQTNHQSVAIGFSGSEENLVLLYRVGIDDPFGRRSLRMDAWVADSHQDALDKLTELWNHSEELPVNLEEFRERISSNPDASILVGPPHSFVARGFDTIWGLNGPSKPNVAPRSSNPNPSTARKAVPIAVADHTTRTSHSGTNPWVFVLIAIGVVAGAGFYLNHLAEDVVINTRNMRDNLENRLDDLTSRLSKLDGQPATKERPENLVAKVSGIQSTIDDQAEDIEEMKEKFERAQSKIKSLEKNILKLERRLKEPEPEGSEAKEQANQ